MDLERVVGTQASSLIMVVTLLWYHAMGLRRLGGSGPI